MASLPQVEAFLASFKTKMGVFTVIFKERDKNRQALIDLEIAPITRQEILRALTPENYYRGPTTDVDSGPDLWEFGVFVKQKEVYIKITMGMQGRPVICISFHCAERSIDYPFKRKL